MPKEGPVRKGRAVVARQTLVRLVDDLDGGEADETIRFGLDGTEYEIDLSKEHGRQLRKDLTVFVDAARRVGAWAQRQGIKVSNRGRIPAKVVRQWRQANR
jgi:Lsr2